MIRINRMDFRVCLLIACCCFLIACGGQTSFRYQTDPAVRELLKIQPLYPQMRFIVISDPHYYDAALGMTGEAFLKDLGRDRKLLKDSSEIMSAMVGKLAGETADFVLVCGDLTKDGERVNHQRVQAALKTIEESGKQVFVVPGNHDVANGRSARYVGKETESVPAISGMQFAEIYHDFGYAQAIMRDPDSLGYVTEPVDGLWLLALDSCRWKENKSDERPHTSGAFSQSTLTWLEKILIRAKRESKAVIAFMHHGVLEHYPGNEKYFARYIVADYQRISEMLASYGVRLLFSGHFHAQDITTKRFQDPEGFIFDIETGSTVGHPSPHRLVEIRKDQSAVVETRVLQSIPSRPEGFASYAKDFVYASTVTIADNALKKYFIPQSDRQLISPAIARAYVAHLEGDEKQPDVLLDTSQLGLWGKYVFWMRKDLLLGWYADLPPTDNRVQIDLITGAYESR